MRVRKMTFLAIGFAVCASFAARASGDWRTASPQSMGIDPVPLQGLVAAIAHGDYPKTTSVLVVYRGRLIFERYFGEGSPDLLNDTRSATKSITSLAVGEAIHDGAIASVSSPAFDYLKDLAPVRNDTPLKQAITIQDLLTMSSAFACNDDDDKSPGMEDRMHEQTNWTRWAVDLPTQVDYRRDAAGLGPWAYCTAGAFLLGQIVQRTTHTPVDEYIERKLLKPLGISKWDWPRSPAGEVMTGGGLRLRARDLAKLGWMLVNDGHWGAREIVPSSWVAAATTPRRVAYPGTDYGYLFWHHDYKTGCGTTSAWFMTGNGGNKILSFRDLDAAVVITRENYNTHGMHQQTDDMLERYVLPALPCKPAH